MFNKFILKVSNKWNESNSSSLLIPSFRFRPWLQKFMSKHPFFRSDNSVGPGFGSTSPPPGELLQQPGPGFAELCMTWPGPARSGPLIKQKKLICKSPIFTFFQIPGREKYLKNLNWKKTKGGNGPEICRPDPSLKI